MAKSRPVKRKGNGATRKNGLWSALKPGPANYTPLSPVVFLPRAAEIYPERAPSVWRRRCRGLECAGAT